MMTCSKRNTTLSNQDVSQLLTESLLRKPNHLGTEPPLSTARQLRGWSALIRVI